MPGRALPFRTTLRVIASWGGLRRATAATAATSFVGGAMAILAVGPRLAGRVDQPVRRVDGAGFLLAGVALLAVDRARNPAREPPTTEPTTTEPPTAEPATAAPGAPMDLAGPAADRRDG